MGEVEEPPCDPRGDPGANGGVGDAIGYNALALERRWKSSTLKVAQAFERLIPAPSRHEAIANRPSTTPAIVARPGATSQSMLSAATVPIRSINELLFISVSSMQIMAFPIGTAYRPAVPFYRGSVVPYFTSTKVTVPSRARRLTHYQASELDGGATIEVKSNVVLARAPATEPANLLPPPQKQAVRIYQRLLQTKDLISHGFIALHCSASSLKTRDLKSFRLISMRTLWHTLNLNSSAFNQFCTLSQKHPGGIPPALLPVAVRRLPLTRPSAR